MDMAEALQTENILLWKSPNEKWTIEQTPYGLNHDALTVIDQATGFCDWPMQYEDGAVAYDFPERLPRYVKLQVKRMYEERKQP